MSLEMNKRMSSGMNKRMSLGMNKRMIYWMKGWINEGISWCLDVWVKEAFQV